MVEATHQEPCDFAFVSTSTFAIQNRNDFHFDRSSRTKRTDDQKEVASSSPLTRLPSTFRPHFEEKPTRLLHYLKQHYSPDKKVQRHIEFWVSSSMLFISAPCQSRIQMDCSLEVIIFGLYKKERCQMDPCDASIPKTGPFEVVCSSKAGTKRANSEEIAWLETFLSAPLSVSKFQAVKWWQAYSIRWLSRIENQLIVSILISYSIYFIS